MKIGISGAGGKLGGEVLKALQSQCGSRDVVAITRDPNGLGCQVEARLGDYDRPNTLLQAYAGLDRLLLIQSPDLRPGVRSSQIIAAIDAATASGVGHIFLVSATGTRERAEPDMGAAYWSGEQRLRMQTHRWTILRSNYFAETLAEQAGMAVATGFLPGLAENRVAFVSRDDVAAACAGALVGDGHVGAIYNITGPESVTGAERAAQLRAFTGQPIDYAVMSEPKLREAMAGISLPPFVIDAIVSMQTAQAEGDYDIVSGDMQKLSGRAPTSLRDVLDGLDFPPSNAGKV